MRPRLLVIGISVLLLAGCAQSNTAVLRSQSPTSASFPLTITDDDGIRVTIDHAPPRIVTFAPSMTEIIFALGLGDRLVGVSGRYDNYPPQARSIQEVGGAGDFGVEPNVEEVVSLRPDLFLTISGGDQWKQQLRKLDVPVVTLNATSFDDLLGDIRTVGELTGAAAAADALTSNMAATERSVESGVVAQGRVTCFFEVYYPPLTTVGPRTFIYDLLEKAGCDPVMSSANAAYPQWSVDKLVADSPQVYLATQESAKSPAAIAARPGFADIQAVAAGHVALIDSDLITRPGPRVVDGLEQVAAALASEA